MAEKLQAGVCGGTWWNSSRTVLSSTTFSPYSLAMNNDIIGCCNPWQTTDHMVLDQSKVARSCAEESNLLSDNSSMLFQDFDSLNPSTARSCSGRSSSYYSSPMMGYALSSPPDWNSSLLVGRSSESNIGSMVEDDMDSTRLEYRQEDSRNGDSQIQKDWDIKSFSSCANQVSPIKSFKPFAYDREFALDQQSVSTVTSGTPSIAAQDFSSGFPLASANSYGSYTHSLFDHADTDQPQHSLFTDQSSNYSSKDSSTNWSMFPASFLNPSASKQQQSGDLHFANSTPFWNASGSALDDIRSNVFNSSQLQYLFPNEDEPNSITKSKTELEELQETGSALMKNNSTACDQPAFKRPRIETPSPLPTFKVRKEKLGDRITALQQLVSPFGKTDTASVLHEAIEYIKFLHAQVNNLSAPYVKNGIPSQHQQGIENLKEQEDSKDLRSRGLCLVPVSSTYPVANESTADFWTPSFGSTYK